MHDSDNSDATPDYGVTLRDLHQSLEKLDALQSLELQHLRLRLVRASGDVEQSSDAISPRTPDCVVSPRRAA